MGRVGFFTTREQSVAWSLLVALAAVGGCDDGGSENLDELDCVAAGACLPDPPQSTMSVPVCGPSQDRDRDQAAFSGLTASSWWTEGTCTSGAMLPPTCQRLALKADGSYAWTAF